MLPIILSFISAKSRLQTAQEKQLRQALTDQELFFSSMSHELRTPLNGILGNLSFLRGALSDDGQAVLRDVEASATVMLGIVNDILGKAQARNGKLAVVLELVSLRELVETTLSSVRVLFQSGIVLIIEIDENIPEFVIIDGRKVKQILTNFLSNASRFTRSGHVKIIALKHPTRDNELYFEVQDTGSGVPIGLEHALFEPYSQANQNTGTGLGLSVCRDFARGMNGEVGYRRNTDGGSIFWLRVPLTASTSAVLVEQHTSCHEFLQILPACEETESVDHSKSFVLVVDDNGMAAANLLLSL
eukprot:TRINITY_DN3514_c0_g1_i1.p1 TRINITY_DN3514_c0_g1~~TRINITY_DN3514_c0_g1_i1.p1  ORF type:complete len:302 (+),score=31.36 TRINITY_DN3514_c0_g1_i1:369-1274(+)